MRIIFSDQSAHDLHFAFATFSCRVRHVFVSRPPHVRITSATRSYPDRHTFVSRPPRFNVAHTAK